MVDIKENVKNILSEIPKNVQLVAATKTRTTEEIKQAIEAGVQIFGENYVQESLPKIEQIDAKIRWHFIGHLQRNKVKFVVPVFSMIETVDSVRLARKINNVCKKINKKMDILIEINSGRESQKNGLLPEDTENFIKEISIFPYIKIKGLMTMGPFTGDPENARPYFIETKKIFEKISKQHIDNVEMKYLSMGMSNSYKVAIEEGANLIRIGTNIFGPRSCKLD